VSNDSTIRSVSSTTFVPTRYATGGQRTGFADDLFASNPQPLNSDEVTLSPAGELAAKLPALGMFGVQPREDGNIHLEDIRDAYKQRMAAFQANLSRALREEGIDRSPAFSLQTDQEGRIRVSGDRPDLDRLQQLFDERPGMSREFSALSGAGSFLRAADRSLEFQAAYTKDPVAAVALFSDLFDDRDSIFTLQVSEEGMNEMFV